MRRCDDPGLLLAVSIWPRSTSFFVGWIDLLPGRVSRRRPVVRRRPFRNNIWLQ